MAVLHAGRTLRRLLLLSVIAVSALFCLAGPSVSSARGDDRIWSALVLATNSPTPKKPAPELARFSGKVQRFFGYNQVELIGSATKSVDEECERWLVPSQNFWVSVKAKQAQGGSYLLDLALFQDKRQLVETEAKLGPDSPLFIRGPMHARGQLLIVLQVLQ